MAQRLERLRRVRRTSALPGGAARAPCPDRPASAGAARGQPEVGGNGTRARLGTECDDQRVGLAPGSQAAADRRRPQSARRRARRTGARPRCVRSMKRWSADGMSARTSSSRYSVTVCSSPVNSSTAGHTPVETRTAQPTQPGHPPLGTLHQSLPLRSRQSLRFCSRLLSLGGGEGQLGSADLGEPSVGLQPAQPQPRVGPRDQHQANGESRGAARPRGPLSNLRVLDLVRVVQHHQRDRPSSVARPRTDALELVIAHRRSHREPASVCCPRPPHQ